MRASGSIRGFTAAELAISLVITATVFASVLGVVLAQQQALSSSESLRTASAFGTDALLELERSLRRAGFGVGPEVALDFLSFRCDAAERLAGVAGRPTCRDRRDTADRLVFLARNPIYRIDSNGENGCTRPTGCPHGNAWVMTARDPAATPPAFTVLARTGQRFPRGQVLLAVCPGGFRYTMATVDTPIDVAAAGVVTVRLKPTVAGNPYFANDFTHECFDTGATVFSVDRRAYSIRTFDGVPWLVLDTGVDLDGDGQDPWDVRDDDDLQLIAPYVEDLQVAYVLERRAGNNGPDSDVNGVVGDDAAAGVPEEPDPAAAGPGYRTGPDDVARRTLHPANVRAVRVSLVLRSERTDKTAIPGWVGDPLPRLENQTRLLSSTELGRYRRQAVSVTVALRNLSSRGMFTY